MSPKMPAKVFLRFFIVSSVAARSRQTSQQSVGNSDDTEVVVAEEGEEVVVSTEGICEV